ncbi:unnamed protein product, partial [Anisakis simplex]|uniref:DNA repair endonuclease XPF (inferred by orthology to a D. melanogaster protein) n=1 Tax=Anisakis simplex TaxID=6269 RepID=A0A0M3JKM2_ANISI
MLSPSKVKREIFSSDDDGDSENEENKEDAQQNDVDEDDKIELLEFERNIMLDTLTDDVLFILARGLGLERLMLHHLSLYSDPKLLVFVINTTQHD